MELGGCPPENEDELDENPRAALRKYLVLLQNKFPIPQELKGINRFSSKSFNLGEYSEAVMLYNEENKLSDRFASFVDKHLPLSWEDTDIPSFEEYCSWRDAQEDEALTLSDYDTTEGWDEYADPDDHEHPADPANGAAISTNPPKGSAPAWNAWAPSSPQNSTRWDGVKSTLDGSESDRAEERRLVALRQRTNVLKQFGLSDEEIKKLI